MPDAQSLWNKLSIEIEKIEWLLEIVNDQTNDCYYFVMLEGLKT